MTSPQRPRAAAPTALEGVTAARLREIITGTDGVTPGPYEIITSTRGDWPSLYVRSREGIVAQILAGIVEERYRRNAEHIARLDPQTVSSMATELLAARQEIARLRGETFLASAEAAEHHRDAAIGRLAKAEAALAAQAQRRDEVVEECATLAYAAAFTWTFNRWHDEQAAIESAEAVREHIEVNTAQQEPK